MIDNGKKPVHIKQDAIDFSGFKEQPVNQTKLPPLDVSAGRCANRKHYLIKALRKRQDKQYLIEVLKVDLLVRGNDWNQRTSIGINFIQKKTRAPYNPHFMMEPLIQ